MVTSSLLTSAFSPLKKKIRDGRIENLWAEMKSEGLSALIVAGRGLITQYGYLEYVTGYCPQVRLAYAVVIPGEEPIMVLPTTSDAWFAKQATQLTDVRAAGQGDVISDQDSLPQVIAAVVTEHHADGGKIGIVGLRHIVPVGDYEMLRAALPNAQLTDATALVGRIKAVKVQEEIDEVLRSAAIADAGLQVFHERAAVGVSGWELWGDMQREVRRRGAREVLIMVGTKPYFNDVPTADPLVEGDLASVYVEITGPNGFWVEKASLFAFGQISSEKRRMAETTLAAHEAAQTQMRVGKTAADVATAIEKIAAPEGVDFGIWHGHGVGIDHDTPVLTESDNTMLLEGMVLALHPNFVNSQLTEGASVADTLIIRQGAPLQASTIAQEIFQIGEGN